MAQVVQDRVSSESSGVTMHCTILEGPINCLAVKRDCTQVVVAGRNVFKLFSIEDDKFKEKANLRVGKNLNLNFSASDVTWNPVEDHLLASAATNGAVVTWNLNKSTRSKQDLVFNEHKRTVNKVSFHGNEHHLLMSGSQDGFMKLFDLRRQEVSMTFNGQSESVRDVQFSPYHYFTFAAAYENGNVQIWDMRNPTKYERMFTAHSGPVFSIDWHPDDRSWLATAGRDRLIKVWDLSNPIKIKNSHSVQTIAAVARIKWRPQRKYHIASCALLLDFSINIWDIRRPYIPFAAFQEHKDVVTGIVWKHNDPHVFLSSGKDCKLYQHMFRDATRPADNANPVGVHINVTGNVAHASSDKLNSSAGVRPNYSSTKLPSFFRRVPDRSEQFTLVSSSLFEFFNHEETEELSMDWFIESAMRYQLSGRSLEELCDVNAKVAIDLERYQVGQTWNMLKVLYSATPTTPSQTSKSMSGLSGKADGHSNKDQDAEKRGDGKPSQDLKTTENEVKEKHVGDTSTDCSFGCDPYVASLLHGISEELTGVSDEESDIQDMEVERGSQLANIASGFGNQNHSEFFFGDGDMDQTGFEQFDSLANMQTGQDWSLPNEAFAPRHEIVERAAPPAPLTQNTTAESPSSANEIEHHSHPEPVVVEERKIHEEILSLTPFLQAIPSWQFTDLVVDLLHYYAEKGDVQMSVSMIIVLGDKIRPHIDEMTQEHWYTSYIELLGRFELWSIANEVIKLSNHTVVGSMNQQSTTFHTNCGRCSKPLLRSGWLCDRCKGVSNTCSICHHPVKGLYVWCQGCSHGGHLQHIKEWLLRSKQCPAGCGHTCEYS